MPDPTGCNGSKAHVETDARRPVARGLILLVKGYQTVVSPWLGRRCRFHPSCSNYCIDALAQHGMFYGLWLTIRRLFRCHPFHPGGFDPVPERKSRTKR